MKTQSIILIIGMFIVIGGLAIFGYFGAAPEPIQGQDYPKIEISPSSFDSGEIEYGDVIEYVFQITNTGSQILEIKKIATSCGCTTAEVSQEQVAPGETINLNVRYDSGAMSGAHAREEQERIIYVKTNDPNNPQAEVIIKAYVK